MLCRLLQVGKLNRNFSISIESHLRGSTFGETTVGNALDYFEIGPVWRCHFEKMATLKQNVGGGALIKNHSPATNANKKTEKDRIRPSQIVGHFTHLILKTLGIIVHYRVPQPQRYPKKLTSEMAGMSIWLSFSCSCASHCKVHKEAGTTVWSCSKKSANHFDKIQQIKCNKI